MASVSKYGDTHMGHRNKPSEKLINDYSLNLFGKIRKRRDRSLWQCDLIFLFRSCRVMLNFLLRKSTAIRAYHTFRPLCPRRPHPRLFSAKGMSRFEEQLLEDKKHDYLEVGVGGVIQSDTDKKYEAVRKLGWGANSTVWIGRDLDEKA